MPKIFNDIDTQMTSHFSGRIAADIADGFPGGQIQCQQEFIHSAPVARPFQKLGSEDTATTETCSGHDEITSGG